MASQPKTPDQIRCTYQRKRVPLEWGARLDDCRRICAEWHNRFGACLVLDDNRFRAICERLVLAGFSVEDVILAIEAYHQYVQTDPWHNEPGRKKAHKTLAAFLQHERFESWVNEGKLARAKESMAETQTMLQQHRAAEAEREVQARDEYHARLLERFRALPADHQAELINRAYDRLTPQLRRLVKAKDLSSKLIRSIVLEILKAEGSPA